MRETVIKTVLLFTGQGSSQHLTDAATVHGLLRQLRFSEQEAFDHFLQDCLGCLQSEVQNLPAPKRSELDEDPCHPFTQFTDAQVLLLPPARYLTHPVFQTVALYLRQILELYVYQSQHDGQSHVVEAAGLCTGILAAALSASFTSYTSQEFLNASLEVLRLAVLIGLHTTIHRGQTSGHDTCNKTWSLVVLGCSLQHVEQHVLYFNEQASSVEPRLGVANVLASDQVLVSGHPVNIERFRSHLQSLRVTSHLSHIHGFYHGGDVLKHVALQVEEDARRRQLSCPTWDSLQIPLRQTTDGHYMLRQEGQSLLQAMLKSIFVDSSDWRSTFCSIVGKYHGLANRDRSTQYRILAFGPGAKALTQGWDKSQEDSGLCIHEALPQLLSYTPVEAIAVVGLAVNYPNGNSKEAFWESLDKGMSSVSDIPSSRFDVSCYQGRGENSRVLNTSYGNFLQDPFGFDAQYFNISPREAKSMDPQQRLLLHAALDALEDAGYAPDSMPTHQRASFGAFIGVATGDYVDNLRNNVDVYYSPGTLRSFLAGRISYFFKWGGPSMVIDTACSSSAVSIHQACQSLIRGECTAALAGGVNTITSPDMYLGLDRAHFLSPTGQCKPWDAAADGYCRSEGCGLVVLKRLADAIAEGDHVYGVIRSTGINQAGTAKSITHPDQQAQTDLIQSVIQKAGISPDTVNNIEAHGTGTQAGDFCESNSLYAVFGKRSKENPLHLSSIKGNIGHAEAASGVAGLAKILMMLQTRRVPPQASFNNLNPRLEAIRNGYLQVPRESMAWQQSTAGHPRRALLNNFGASGSNAALLIEEHVSRGVERTRVTNPKPIPITDRSLHILNLSAKSEGALRELQKAYASYIKSNPSLNVSDLCYSANARRIEYDSFRLGVNGKDASSLVGALEDHIPYSSWKVANVKRTTIFVFSGQGGVHRGMGKELLATSSSFRQTITYIDAILSKEGFPTVSTFLQGLDTPKDQTLVDKAIEEQVSCFAIEFALAQLYMSFGIEPDLVLGHSIGEYAAFVTAGILTLEDALLLVARRARSMTSTCEIAATGMCSVSLRRNELEDLMQQDRFKDLQIACYNSPESHVVAGPTSSLESFMHHCQQSSVRCKRLQVPFAYHSAAMDNVLAELGQHTKSVEIASSRVQLGSSLYGRLLEKDETIDPDYFVSHCRQPVRFHDLLTDLSQHLTDSHACAVEIGPSPSTQGMLSKALDSGSYTFMPSLKPHDEAWTTVLRSLQELYLQRYPIRWRAVYVDSGAKFLNSLPRYPLDPKTYVVPFTEPVLKEATLGEEQSKFSLLSAISSCDRAPDTLNVRSATAMAQIEPYIRAHIVGDVPLCPASVFIEVAMETYMTVKDSLPSSSFHVFDQMKFDKPLVLAEQKTQPELRTELRGSPGGFQQVVFESGDGVVHCHANYTCWSSDIAQEVLSRRRAFAHRQKQRLHQDHQESKVETLSSRTIYQTIFPRVVRYSQPFTTLQRLMISPSGLEGLGFFDMPATTGQQLFVQHPAFVDTLLHSAGFLANAHCDTKTACICAHIDRIILPSLRPDVRKSQHLQVYCSLIDVDHSYVADAVVLGPEDEIVACIEGMQFKKIPLRSFTAHLSRAAKPIKSTASARHQSSHQLTISDLEVKTKSASCAGKGPELVTSLMRLINEVCGTKVDTDSTDRTLEELGIDSLLLIELQDGIGKHFPSLEVGGFDLHACRTVQDVIDILSKSVVTVPKSMALPPPALTDDSSNVTSTCMPSTPAEATLSGSETLIGSLLERVCGFKMEGEIYEKCLGDLGIDSLLSIEVLQELQDELDMQIDGGAEVIPEMTATSLQNLYSQQLLSKGVDQGVAQSRSSQLLASPLTGEKPFAPARSLAAQHVKTDAIREFAFPEVLQAGQRDTSNGSKCDLLLFHDGSGLTSPYERLLSQDRKVAGFYCPDDVHSSLQIESLEALATLYIKRSNLTSCHDVILGGWSFGGVLAFEVGRQLQRHGCRVQGLVLIDAPPPIDHDPLSDEIIEMVSSSMSRGRQLKSERARDLQTLVKTRFQRHASMLAKYDVQPEGKFSCILLNCTRSIDAATVRNTAATPWLTDMQYRDQAAKLWGSLVLDSVTELSLDCDHFGVFDKDSIHETSVKLRQACEMLDEL